jgi:hypothetical protein
MESIGCKNVKMISDMIHGKKVWYVMAYYMEEYGHIKKHLLKRKLCTRTYLYFVFINGRLAEAGVIHRPDLYLEIYVYLVPWHVLRRKSVT